MLVHQCWSTIHIHLMAHFFCFYILLRTYYRPWYVLDTVVMALIHRWLWRKRLEHTAPQSSLVEIPRGKAYRYIWVVVVSRWTSRVWYTYTKVRKYEWLTSLSLISLVLLLMSSKGNLHVILNAKPSVCCRMQNWTITILIMGAF